MRPVVIAASNIEDEIAMRSLGLLLSTTSIFSMLLRVGLLAVKFAFTMALAHYTNASTLGVYALIVAVVTIAIYFIGAELHTYVVREVVVADKLQRSAHIQNHLAFVCLFCLVGLPLSWAVICWLHVDNVVPFVFFAVVLLGEVLCQELGRYLNALGLPLSSNVLQLLRGAAWMPFAIGLFRLSTYPSIAVILVCWALGCFCAIAFGVWRLRQFIGPLGVITLGWLQRTLQDTKFYFLVAVLAQIQNYADRLIVQKNLGAQYVGQLAFFQSFANTVQGFVLTGVVSIALPELLTLVRTGQYADATKVSERMLLGGSLVAAAVSTCLIIGIGRVLAIVGKSEYVSALGLLPWMLLGNYFIVLGQVQHYRLYALKKDRTLLLFAMTTTPLALILNLAATRTFGLNGTVGSFVVVSVGQTILKWRLANKAWRLKAIGSYIKT